MPVEGVVAAVVTPHRESGHEIDLGATFEIIDFLCSKKPAGLALFGATGEFVHFDFDERVRLIPLAVRRSRVPVIVNVSHTTLAASLQLAEEAASSGAAGLLLMPPHFFRYSQQEIEHFYLEFARQSRGIPTYLYNLPFFTNPMEPATAVRLLETGKFAGIKDSSGNWEMFESLLGLKQRQPYTLLIGNDSLYVRGRKGGANGGISGVCCGIPELMLALDQAICKGDDAKATLLESRVNEYIEWLNRFPVPVGIRETLRARKMKVGNSAIPASPGLAPQLEEFQAWLLQWLPQVLSEAAAH